MPDHDGEGGQDGLVEVHGRGHVQPGLGQQLHGDVVGPVVTVYLMTATCQLAQRRYLLNTGDKNILLDAGIRVNRKGSAMLPDFKELPEKLDLEKRKACFVWIAPNKLYIQSYCAIKGYFAEMRSIKPVFFEDITDGGIKPNEVLFVNWESINLYH